MSIYQYLGLILLTTVGLTAVSFAQPDSLWSRTYGGQEYDNCWNMIQTADSGFALVGTLDRWGEERNQYAYFVKTDRNGELEFSQFYGGDGFEDCWSVLQTTDGGYLLSCGTDSFGAVNGDAWIVKIDSTGEVEWSQLYGGNGSDHPRKIISDDDSTFVFVGWTSDGPGSRSTWLVKIGWEGEEIWSRLISGEGRDGCSDIIKTRDGGFALSGATTSFGAGDVDGYLVKVNSEGEEEWSRAYGSEQFQDFSSIVQTPDGGYALAGDSGSLDVDGDLDCYIVRVDSTGDELWHQLVNNRGYDACRAIMQTEDGGYAYAGTGHFNFMLVKTGPDPENPDAVRLLDPAYPSSFILHPPYPNPFNSRSIISYYLPSASNVSLRIFNQAGREITTLFNGSQSTGYHSVTWNSNNAPTGVYVCRLITSAGQVDDRKLVLVR